MVDIRKARRLRDGWRHVRIAALTAVVAARLPDAARADTVLFVGNSFTFAYLSQLWHYRADSVTDLNKEGVGGVPALFKVFTQESGLQWQVSLETSAGKDLQWHVEHKAADIGKPFDHVVLQSFSTLDAARPGDSAGLVKATRTLTSLLRARNPNVDIWLDSTWSRADLTYQPTGHWYGKPIDAMEKEVRAGYDKAAAAAPGVHGVLPVGQAFNRAIESGLATANPYKRTGPGQINLWAADNYHASTYGYYLEALVCFGAITGKDPRLLGPAEKAAADLGISPTLAARLQRIAYDELASGKQG